MNIGEARPPGETADGVTKAASRRALGLRPNTKANCCGSAFESIRNAGEQRAASTVGHVRSERSRLMRKP
jgi:hypothetical protein